MAEPGSGLAIAQGVVRSHAGRIAVQQRRRWMPLRGRPAGSVADGAIPVRVLLTGGAGFIGSVVARPPAGRRSRRRRARPGGRRPRRRHRPGPGAIGRGGLPGVVHLAAKVGLGVDISDIDDYVRQNDLGTAVVLRAAAEAGVSRIVYASSMVVYGEGTYSAVTTAP